MMKQNKQSWHWIFVTASRFFSTKRKEKGHLSSILSILGLGVGVMALIAVIGVMNGFQSTYIENILEVGSFHLRYPLKDKDPDQISSVIEKMNGVKAALPVIESETLVSSDFGEPFGLLLKAFPRDYYKRDKGLVDALTIVKGRGFIENPNEIVIGHQLSQYLSIELGDSLHVVKLKGVKTFNLGQETEEFKVVGFFRTGYLEYDQNVAIIDYEKGLESYVGPDGPFLGIKLQNENQDRRFLAGLSDDWNPEDFITWREFNKSFFGALKMEKMMMMFLVGLIFLVVGFNINHIMNRAVLERSEEIAILRALGASPWSLQMVFWLEGALIGFLGGLGGTIAGLWLGANVNTLFNVIEGGLNSIIGLINHIFSILGDFYLDEVRFYSSGLFYLEGMPCKFYLNEVFLITFAGIAAAWLASYRAAGRIVKMKPMEILRDE